MRLLSVGWASWLRVLLLNVGGGRSLWLLRFSSPEVLRASPLLFAFYLFIHCDLCHCGQCPTALGAGIFEGSIAGALGFS
jgi:hypothetical protein